MLRRRRCQRAHPLYLWCHCQREAKTTNFALRGKRIKFPGHRSRPLSNRVTRSNCNMQSIRRFQGVLPLLRAPVYLNICHRRLLSTGSPLPWFVEEQVPSSFAARQRPPHITIETPSPIAPAPTDAPEILKALHARLADSPHLDTSTLILSQAMPPPEGPPLPLRMPHGRRKRGGTYFGESHYDTTNGIWNWVIIAQVSNYWFYGRSNSNWFLKVKEGTENRGAIESVVRTVRKMVRLLMNQLQKKAYFLFSASVVGTTGAYSSKVTATDADRVGHD